jgi:hypothetical protein
VSSAAATLVSLLLSAATTRILHCGQAAETIEMSRAVSRSQPVPCPEAGSGAVFPSWLTSRKQPLAAVQAGSRYSLR